jgi:hypothetical protein
LALHCGAAVGAAGALFRPLVADRDGFLVFRDFSAFGNRRGKGSADTPRA